MLRDVTGVKRGETVGLGGRWLQEHYHLLGSLQETYSYYGPLNWVMLNMGFHNEHHDFPMVAWHRLPQLSRLAPDFYQPLWAHQSYTRLLLHFIFDENLSAFSRWVRSDAQKPAGPASHHRHTWQTPPTLLEVHEEGRFAPPELGTTAHAKRVISDLRRS